MKSPTKWVSEQPELLHREIPENQKNKNQTNQTKNPKGKKKRKKMKSHLCCCFIIPVSNCKYPSCLGTTSSTPHVYMCMYSICLYTCSHMHMYVHIHVWVDAYIHAYMYTCVGRCCLFIFWPPRPEIITQKLYYLQHCLANSLGFLLTNSYILN